MWTLKRLECGFFLLLILTVNASGVYAGKITPGIWGQTSSTAGECLDCTITITEETPHMIKILANNGWVGYAHYVPAKDEYHGFLELEKGAAPPGANWKNTVFSMKLFLDLVTVNIEGWTNKIRFKSTYRIKKELKQALVQEAKQMQALVQDAKQMQAPKQEQKPEPDSEQKAEPELEQMP